MTTQSASPRSLDRRGFLTAGAVLAAGGLALPRSALGATLPLSAPAAPSADLTARLRAVLGRPNEGWYGATGYDCQCSRCRALRRREWECLECGYEGPWVVTACECREVRASSIAFLRKEIAAIEAGRPDKPGGYTLDQLRDGLADDERLPDTMCLAHPEQTVRLARHPHCAHGLLSCPACGNDGGGCPMDDATPLLNTLREIHAVLRAAGGAP